jgi:hypothetical protein
VTTLFAIAARAASMGPRAAMPFRIIYLTPTMRTILASTTLCLGLSAGFWFALTSSLTDMTKADCQAGVQRACDQLKKDGAL